MSVLTLIGYRACEPRCLQRMSKSIRELEKKCDLNCCTFVCTYYTAMCVINDRPY